MSALVVKTGIMNQCAATEADIAKKINNIAQEIDDVRRNLSFTVRSRANINTNLKTLVRVCNTNAAHVKSLSKTLSDAVSTYMTAEKDVISSAAGVGAAVMSSGAGHGSFGGGFAESTDTPSWWEKLKDFGLDDFADLLKEFGLFGGALGFITTMFTGDPTDLFKSGFSLIKTVSKLDPSVATWKDFFKIGDWDNWKDQIGDFSFKSNKLTAAVSWGGAILDLGVIGYDNYVEYGGDWSNPEMYVETGVEFAVSKALEYGVGALATAVGGPVAGTVAVMLFNYADSKLNITETISDGIIDFGKHIGEAAKQTGEIISEGYKNVKESIASWFKW